MKAIDLATWASDQPVYIRTCAASLASVTQRYVPLAARSDMYAVIQSARVALEDSITSVVATKVSAMAVRNATLDRQVAALSAALGAVQSDQRALSAIKHLVQLQSQLIEVLQQLVDGLQQVRR